MPARTAEAEWKGNLTEGTGRIKVLEAMAHGAPLVATRQAVAGVDVVAGADVIVADDPEGLARETARLLGDPGAAAALGAAGRAFWERNHDPAAARLAGHVDQLRHGSLHAARQLEGLDAGFQFGILLSAGSAGAIHLLDHVEFIALLLGSQP